jgi:hypothetical protein
MGSATGLPADQVRPWLASLRGCGYSGDIALFVSGRLHRQLRRDPLAANVQLLRARSLLPLNFRRVYDNRALWMLWRLAQAVLWTTMTFVSRAPLPARARGSLQVAIAQRACTPMDARFFYFLRYLRLHPYERVLLTDVRDVLFQRDPFIDIPPSGLAVSIETRRYTIASEPNNRRWLADAFGPKLVKEIGANPVSCVGVTCGDAGAMGNYLGLMTKEMLRLPAKVARTGGADTAIHNALLWTDQLESVQPLETLASPVATLNAIPEDEVKLSTCGTLLNTDGSEPSVVHQYDRVRGLAPALLQALTVEETRPSQRTGDYASAG